MIRVFASLKWRLTMNGIRRRRSEAWAITMLIVTVAGAMIFFVPAIAIGARTTGDPQTYRGLAIGTFTGLFALWLVLTVAMGGADETVDPSRLALLPLTRRQLVTGLAVAATVGLGPLLTLLVLSAVVAGFAPAGVGAVLVVAATLIALAMNISATRAVATLLTRAQRSRRGRDIAVLAATLGAVGLWLATQLIGRLSDEGTNRIMDVLRWTPPGFLGQSVLDAAGGEFAASLVNLLVAALTVVLFTALWASTAFRLLVEDGRSLRTSDADAVAAPDASALAPWAAGSEFQAALHKELRYSVRSPSRRTALLMNTIMGSAFTLLQLLSNDDRSQGLVLFGASAGLLFSLSYIDNQFGYDGAPMWMEVAANGPRLPQILGRSASWLPVVALPAVPTSITLAVLTGGWKYVPATVLLAVVLAGVPLGVGSVVSVKAPLPMPDNGKPFGNASANTGRGCAVGVFSLVAMVVDVALLAPAVVMLVVAQRAGSVWLYVAVVPVAAWSWLIWRVGAHVALRQLRGCEPELLEALQLRA